MKFPCPSEERAAASGEGGEVLGRRAAADAEEDGRVGPGPGVGAPTNHMCH